MGFRRRELHKRQMKASDEPMSVGASYDDDEPDWEGGIICICRIGWCLGGLLLRVVVCLAFRSGV